MAMGHRRNIANRRTCVGHERTQWGPIAYYCAHGDDGWCRWCHRQQLWLQSDLRSWYRIHSRWYCKETHIGLLPDTQCCGLRMRRECRERFPRQRLQSKPLVNDPGMHHGMCVTHVSWWSLTYGGGENVPGFPGEYATRKFPYLVRSRCTYVLIKTYAWIVYAK